MPKKERIRTSNLPFLTPQNQTQISNLTFWSFARLAKIFTSFLSTAYKCNWHSVKVLHKEGKGGQVSIQPFTAEGNSLCHIHLHLHRYQAGKNLKLTNISIDFVQVMEQISYVPFVSLQKCHFKKCPLIKLSQQFTENVFFFNSFLMSLQKHKSWYCQIPTHFYSELIRPIHFANACYLEMSPN